MEADSASGKIGERCRKRIMLTLATVVKGGIGRTAGAGAHPWPPRRGATPAGPAHTRRRRRYAMRCWVGTRLYSAAFARRHRMTRCVERYAIGRRVPMSADTVEALGTGCRDGDESKPGSHASSSRRRRSTRALRGSRSASKKLTEGGSRLASAQGRHRAGIGRVLDPITSKWTTYGSGPDRRRKKTIRFRRQSCSRQSGGQLLHHEIRA